MDTRTKMICTIGPAVNNLEKIMALIKEGMNVARVNMSHGTQQDHARTIDLLKEARDCMHKPLAILMDLQGPEIRLGEIENEEMELDQEDLLILSKDDCIGKSRKVCITPGYVLNDLKKGTKILFNDGHIASEVVEEVDEGVVVQIKNSGVISSKKGVNIPDVKIDLPAITEKDIEDLAFACEQNVDIIAASFVRSHEHVLQIKELLAEKGHPEIWVIAKIENSAGINNFDAILHVSDGIMIARGDLGVEVPLSQVPRLQKMMIRKSYLEGKPSVTATQMLESMIHNPRPTRAEASDVANAIYDGTSAIMLSAETAMGQYPIEAVRVMKSIVRESEIDCNYRDFFDLHSRIIYQDVPSAVTLATVKTAYSCHARAIFAFTASGQTGRLLSRLRPEMPIIATTPTQKSYHQMALNWGIYPLVCDVFETVEEAFQKVSAYAMKEGYVSYGDLVILAAGTPFGVSGSTNMIIVENIGDVLVRAAEGVGSRIHGKVKFLFSSEGVHPYEVNEKIIVIPKCDESYLPFINEALAVILQNPVDDEKSERYLMKIAEKIGKPVLIRADGARAILREGQRVTIHPEKALVYKGVVL